VATHGELAEEFGASVAVSRNIIVVGAPHRTVGSKDFQGMVYVFLKPKAQLTVRGANREVGRSVAISGNTIVASGNLAVQARARQPVFVFVKPRNG
jgi:FG-GAP repeat